jgi:hypothetical protein
MYEHVKVASDAELRLFLKINHYSCDFNLRIMTRSRRNVGAEGTGRRTSDKGPSDSSLSFSLQPEPGMGIFYWVFRKIHSIMKHLSAFLIIVYLVGAFILCSGHRQSGSKASQSIEEYRGGIPDLQMPSAGADEHS